MHVESLRQALTEFVSQLVRQGLDLFEAVLQVFPCFALHLDNRADASAPVQVNGKIVGTSFIGVKDRMSLIVNVYEQAHPFIMLLTADSETDTALWRDTEILHSPEDQEILQEIELPLVNPAGLVRPHFVQHAAWL